MVLIFHLLLYGPWICALILALKLPKTWVGRGVALLLAVVFIYVDWHTIEKWNKSGGLSNLFEVPAYHLVLLLLCVAPVVIRKESSKASLAVLFAIWSWCIAFPGYWPGKEDLKDGMRESLWKIGIVSNETVFQIKCKKAGTSIYRTVENVDGVAFFPSPQRPFSFGWNRGRYRYLDIIEPKVFIRQDERGRSSVRDEWTWTRFWSNRKTEYYELNVAWHENRNSDQYVYDLVFNTHPALDPLPRYAVIGSATRDKNVIEGTFLKIVDLQTKEVLAEQISYSMSRTYRPRECPEPSSKRDFDKEMEDFIVAVLKPPRPAAPGGALSARVLRDAPAPQPIR